MRILVAPDSYKGSLSAEKVGQIIKSALEKEIADITVEMIPMADGGEGTVDAFLYTAKGERIKIEVTGPTGEKVTTHFGVLTQTRTVVMEVADIAGFTSVREKERNPYHLTTYGIGECIKHALDSGYRKFIIGLGESATNDAGMGMLSALGVSFKNKEDKIVDPYPRSFETTHFVDYSTLDQRLLESEIIIASDVDNPLCGQNGATYIFGPQKGVKGDQLNHLDEQIEKFAIDIEAHLGSNYREQHGAGAAGGLGFAMLTIGAKIESGAKLIARTLNVESEISKSNWVITGEGKTDHQTLQGKLPFFIASLAKGYQVPTILISGSLEGNISKLYDVFESMHAISSGPLTLEESIDQTEYLLHHKARNIARLLKHTDTKRIELFKKDG